MIKTKTKTIVAIALITLATAGTVAGMIIIHRQPGTSPKPVVSTNPRDTVTKVCASAGECGGTDNWSCIGGKCKSAGCGDGFCNDCSDAFSPCTPKETNTNCAQDCKGGVTPVCGNGKLETGEECDDGNARSGDGCSAGCKKEDATPAEKPGTIDLGNNYLNRETCPTDSSCVTPVNSGYYGTSDFVRYYKITKINPGATSLQLYTSYSDWLGMEKIVMAVSNKFQPDEQTFQNTIKPYFDAKPSGWGGGSTDTVEWSRGMNSGHRMTIKPVQPGTTYYVTFYNMATAGMESSTKWITYWVGL